MSWTFASFSHSKCIISLDFHIFFSRNNSSVLSFKLFFLFTFLWLGEEGVVLVKWNLNLHFPFYLSHCSKKEQQCCSWRQVSLKHHKSEYATWGQKTKLIPICMAEPSPRTDMTGQLAAQTARKDGLEMFSIPRRSHLFAKSTKKLWIKANTRVNRDPVSHKGTTVSPNAKLWSGLWIILSHFKPDICVKR